MFPKNIRLSLDKNLQLVHNVSQSFIKYEDYAELHILHTGYNLEADIKKNAEIYPTQLLAKCNSDEKGHLFSSVYGKVTDVDGRFIYVQVLPEPQSLSTDANAQEESEQAKAQQPSIEKLSADKILENFSKPYAEALEFARNMGINPKDIAKECDTLIVNGLNAEPGVTWAEPLLNEYLPLVLQGLELQKALSKPKEIILVVHENANIKPIANIKIVEVKPTYPISIPKLLAKEVTGTECPKNTEVVSTHTLWGLGFMRESGFPLACALVTLKTPAHTANYIIKEGTKVNELLAKVDVELKFGDTVALGGPLGGASIAVPTRGIPRDIKGVIYVPAGSIPVLEGGSHCCNCGACDRVCPARLSPSILSKYSEFHMLDKCEEWYASYCLECGLCGYVCVMRRPVLQYIRLAKQQLALRKMELVSRIEEIDENEEI